MSQYDRDSAGLPRCETFLAALYFLDEQPTVSGPNGEQIEIIVRQKNLTAVPAQAVELQLSLFAVDGSLEVDPSPPTRKAPNRVEFKLSLTPKTG